MCTCLITYSELYIFFITSREKEQSVQQCNVLFFYVGMTLDDLCSPKAFQPSATEPPALVSY